MWLDIVIVALFIFAGYAFLRLIGFQTSRLSRRTKRTAESLYPNYADSPRKQHRYAQEHGGSWSQDGGERR
jgi:hypothetical protein